MKKTALKIVVAVFLLIGLPGGAWVLWRDGISGQWVWKAVRAQDVDTLNWLIKFGADVNQPNDIGLTPLDYVMAQQKWGAFLILVKIADLLLTAGGTQTGAYCVTELTREEEDLLEPLVRKVIANYHLKATKYRIAVCINECPPSDDFMNRLKDIQHIQPAGEKTAGEKLRERFKVGLQDDGCLLVLVSASVDARLSKNEKLISSGYVDGGLSGMGHVYLATFRNGTWELDLVATWIS